MRHAADVKTILAEFRQFPDALIGCCTGDVSGFVNLDVDDEEGRERIDELVPDSLMVPTYKTISGGQQMIFKAPSPCPAGVVRFLPGLDFRGDRSCTILPPSELGYKWLPGLSLAEVKAPLMPAALLAAVNNINDRIYKGRNSCNATAEKMFDLGRRDNDLFHVANHLTKGGMPDEEIAQVLEHLIISWGETPDPKWISDKIESAKKRDLRRSGDITKAIEEWVSVTDGYFSVTDCRQALQSITDSDQTTFRVILHRLAKRGVIEKNGHKDGVYRRIVTEIEPLDWKNADTNPLPLHWPFLIERLVSIYPGNIAIIAGSPNAGKTAFILNFIKLNQDHQEIHLFSSEGGKEELNQRIAKFGLPFDDWTFHAWERSGNFQDCVKPNAINIIDYLEIHDDFYKVGGQIKAIADRLKTGFALIALQKPTGRDAGLGGERGLEKPRLYLAMDGGRLKIVKAKSWARCDQNPNGLIHDFKIIDGCKFHTTGDWKK